MVALELLLIDVMLFELTVESSFMDSVIYTCGLGVPAGWTQFSTLSRLLGFISLLICKKKL